MESTNYRLEDLVALEVGASLELRGQGKLVRLAVNMDNGLVHQNDWKTGTTTITRKDNHKANLRKLIYSELSEYAGGDLYPDTKDLRYTRNLVSAFNKEHGTNFSVTTKDGRVCVYADLESLPAITQEQYDMVKADFQRRLDALKTKIVGRGPEAVPEPEKKVGFDPATIDTFRKNPEDMPYPNDDLGYDPNDLVRRGFDEVLPDADHGPSGLGEHEDWMM